MGWFTFGTFLILKGAFLNSVYEQKQSGGSYGYGRTFGRSFTLTEELGYGTGPEEIYFDLPYIEEWTVSARNFSLRTDSRTCHFHTNWNVKLSYSWPYMPVTVSPFPVHNMPVSQGLKLVFPVDNSLQGCYKQRESCVARDFSGEVGF